MLALQLREHNRETGPGEHAVQSEWGDCAPGYTGQSQDGLEGYRSKSLFRQYSGENCPLKCFVLFQSFLTSS